MFPRHVRWYRLLLLLLVVVNCDEAIAKTESNLNLDSGSGIIVTCPAASTGSPTCGGVAPPIQPSFMNSISDGDIAAFELIGGSITGSPCGQIIILAFETGSGTTFDGCDFVTRQYIVYDDANFDEVLESSEFVQSCAVEYIIGDNQAPDVVFSEDLYLDCFTFDIESSINNWLESGGYSYATDCSNVSITNDFDTDFDFCATAQYLVNFTFTDACGNESSLERTIYFFHDEFINCSPGIFVDCYNEDLFAPITTIAEFNYSLGYINLCSNDITITHEDGPNAVSSICEIPVDQLYSFSRTYYFTDNTCGITYECTHSIDLYRNAPSLNFPSTECIFGIPSESPIAEKDLSQYLISANGCGDLLITFEDSPHGCGDSFIRTYTITDECGTSNTYEENYFKDPVFTFQCEPDITISYCESPYQSSGNISPLEFSQYGTTSDFCGSLSISYQDTPSNLGPCDYGIPISREYTFTTECGAVETCVSQITFEVSDLEVFCPYIPPVSFEGEIPTPFATVEDIVCNGGYINNMCASVAILSVVDTPEEPDFYGGNEIDFIERVYTFINECGQTTECTQFIEYFTGLAPASTLSCDTAADFVIDCNDADPNGPTINDLVLVELENCETALETANPGSTAVHNFSSITYSGSGTTQDVIFTLSDGSGNTLDCPKTITIIGDCPIGVDCSAATDIVVDCNDADPPATTINDLIAIEVDNCNAAIEAASTSPDGGPVTVTNNYTLLTYSGSGSSQDVIFTVTDNQGTETECTKSISIVGDCKFVICPPTLILTCEDGVPPPATSFAEFLAMGGQYDFLNCGPLSITSILDGEFEDLNFCSNGLIELKRTYILTDDCGQRHICEQNINYSRHTEGPEITCPSDITVDVNTGDCSYEATLVPPSATSTCPNVGVVSVTSQFANNEVNLAEGQHIIQWTAIDECGIATTCQQTITVVGTGNDFSIICNGSASAFLEANGFANVPAQQFVNTIYDACGSSGPYVYEIRRLNPGPCSNGTGDVYSPFISVCCEDLAGGRIDVSIRVTDANGNQAVCDAEILVRDLIPPTVVFCPSDVDVSCTEIIDLQDLNQYGIATGSDNCPGGLIITESVEDLREDCGLGQIIRTFTFKDIANNIVTCSQTLNVYNNDPLQESDIVWPADNTYTNLCNFDIPEPGVAGVPAYPSNLCSQPLVDHTDEVLIAGQVV